MKRGYQRFILTASSLRLVALLAYAVDLQELSRGPGAQLDKIFRGAEPGTIPIRQPTRFEFLISQRTAKTIGLPIPFVLLAQADEVID